MIKIPNNEEFSAAGRVWMFHEENGKVTLKNIRAAGKTKEFIPPTLDEVKSFFKERGYTEEAALKFYDYYSLGDWKDGKGNRVKNWRQKASSVWFRDEHKIVNLPVKEKKESKFLFGE